MSTKVPTVMIDGFPELASGDAGKVLVVEADESGYRAGNLSNDFAGLKKKSARASFCSKRFTTDATGAQSRYLFVGRLAQYSGARLEVIVVGSVGGIDFGQVARVIDLYRAAGPVKARDNTPTAWTVTVDGGGSVSANFFVVGTQADPGDDGQFLIGVAFVPTGPSTFIEARASISGDYGSFGAVDLSQYNDSVESVDIFPVTGQSNAQGYNSQSYTTLDALDPGRAQMFNKGFRLLSDLISPSEVVGNNYILAAVDAKERRDDATFSFQSIGSTFLNGYLRTKASKVGGFMANAAVGGQAYSALKNGTIPYSNLLAAINRIRSICSAEIRATRIPAIICDHGESNLADSKATYLAHLIEWQSDWNATLDEQDEVPFLGSQYSHSNSGGPPHAWLQAALDDPTKFILAGAKYHYTYTDGVHLDGKSVAMYGYYLARALRLWESGQQYPFMYIESAVKTGNTVLLTVHMPIEGTSLVLDTDRVTNPGGIDPYGLRYVDSFGQTISEVAIIGQNQIQLTLTGSATPATKTLHIAQNAVAGSAGGPTTGPRSCFRDDNTDTERLPLYGVQPMYNWLCHQIIDVT